MTRKAEALLRRWRKVVHESGNFHLEGYVYGHPGQHDEYRRCRDGSYIHTTNVIWMEGGVAETQNTLYTLDGDSNP